MAARRDEQNRLAAQSPNGLVALDVIEIEGHPPRHIMISLFPIRDRRGVTKHVGGIGLDMTGMGNMIADAPVAVAMLDKEMNYLAVSRRWSAEFEAPAGGYHGRSVYDLPPLMPDRWRRIQQHVLAGASLKEDKEPWAGADGSSTMVSLGGLSLEGSYQPARGDSGFGGKRHGAKTG